MTQKNTIKIGNHEVGNDLATFVIAEAGVNHNGDLELAYKLIDAAKEAGADAVKFQTFTPEELVSEIAPQAAYQVKNTGKEESQFSMLQKLVLPYSAHAALKSYAEEEGLVFLSTPFSIPDAEFLESLDIAAFKVPSGELTNVAYLVYIAQTKRPIILSTGMGTLEEVREALQILRDNGATNVVVLHCTSEYPTPSDHINLRAMQTMAKEFDIPVGYSDHSAGIAVSIAAVTLGACVIEKHFTLDKNLPGPDHKASLEPRELKQMIEGIREIELALGSAEKKPTEKEMDTARIARKSVVARRNIVFGAVITPEDLYIVRPGTGIPPKHFGEILGKVTKQEIPQGTPIQWEMIS